MKWAGLREGLVLIAAAIIAAVWIYSVRFSDRIHDRQYKETLANAENVVKSFENNAAGTLNEVGTTLNVLALSIVDARYPAMADIVSRGYYNRALIRGFAVVAPSGFVTYQSTPGLLPEHAGDLPAVAIHYQSPVTGLYIGIPERSGVDGPWSMAISRPLHLVDGAPGGVLVAVVDPLYFVSFYPSVSIGARGNVALVGMDGVVRLRRSRAGVDEAAASFPNALLLQHARLSPEGVFPVPGKGGVSGSTVTYRRVAGYPLVVTVSVAQADVDAAVHGIIRMLFAGAVAFSLAVFLGTAFLITQWRVSDRLRLALKVNRDFLARVSHELRTPLNAIIGFSEMIRDQVLGTGPAASERYLEYARDIHASGQELLGLVNDILDLSGLQAGRTVLKREPVDVDATIEWALRVMAPQADRKDIVLEKNILPGVGTVMADVRALRQMLLNLLSNAVKFTPRGGRIMVIALAGRGRRGCMLRVCDTGIGMTPEQVEQAAIPFGQDSALAARDGQGHGLGLSIVKALIEAQGGRLRIDSQPGQGSQVTLEFAA
ncbi:signal transduction histidine kinase [Azospirillum fermentarium]|uniref:sensor histidine kinase n=1 Tax=Azospirillum fermentarium TaxID=1233114 RepID=UPI0022263DB2|nr:sensor histidine kinase [Azospirillum fermentarium]MCW2246831.1 signal transduction histidine kinase [Azospirillum fermentarium]